MKLQHLQGILLVGALHMSGICQPANDNFTNRIFLAGSDISFSGTLAGATRTSNPSEVIPTFLNSASQTVWWQWTPTQATTVIIEILNPTKPTLGSDGVAVYKLTDISTGPQISGLKFNELLPKWFFSFSAIAGTNYCIQLAGASGASFDLRLIATNLPVIITPPENQSISAGDSALFTVVATGRSPLKYQWQLQGTNLPGETAPMLAIDNAQSNQAGDYVVWITNSTGVVVSAPVKLIVTTTDPAPIFLMAQLQPTNKFAFSLVGDPGRRYEIHSSTDLVHWDLEACFAARSLFDPILPSQPPLRSMGSDATGTNHLSVMRTKASAFFRAALFHANNEVCYNNLTRIKFAKLLLATDRQLDSTASLRQSDLLPYFKDGRFPRCPSGGTYVMDSLSSTPVCSISSHP